MDVAAVWAAVEEVVSREAVIGALAQVEQLVPKDDGAADVAMRAELVGQYNTVRPSLVLLGESNALGAAGRRVLVAAPASMLLHFAPGALREGYFEGLPTLAGKSDGGKAAFFREHDTYWL